MEKRITIELNRRQAEVMNTLLSTEIMKLDLHYGTQKHTERQDTCYAIRDKLIEARENECEILYLVQAYHTQEDKEYKRHLHPSYLTSYSMHKGGPNFGLQSGWHDALKFESKQTAREWMKYASEVFKDREWDVVPMNRKLMGKIEPAYVMREVDDSK